MIFWWNQLIFYTRRCHLVERRHTFLCPFTVSLNALFRMTIHVIASRSNLFRLICLRLQRVCRVVCNAEARWNTVDPLNQDSAALASVEDGHSRGRVSLENIAVRLLLHFDLPKASDHSCHTEMATQMFPKTAKKHCWMPWSSATATVLVQVPTMMWHTRITLHPAQSSAAVKGSDSQAAYRTLARTLFRFATEPIEKGA